jgi:hypothetical protein
MRGGRTRRSRQGFLKPPRAHPGRQPHHVPGDAAGRLVQCGPAPGRPPALAGPRGRTRRVRSGHVQDHGQPVVGPGVLRDTRPFRADLFPVRATAEVASEGRKRSQAAPRPSEGRRDQDQKAFFPPGAAARAPRPRQRRGPGRFAHGQDAADGAAPEGLPGRSGGADGLGKDRWWSKARGASIPAGAGQAHARRLGEGNSPVRKDVT